MSDINVPGGDIYDPLDEGRDYARDMRAEEREKAQEAASRRKWAQKKATEK